ncbi:neuronal acetylcholine receptor subunit alpha-3-like [Amphiura filiformis]|uniref:neuronal acetylcholine receptor subunit alpha-3-like n=1 Tax=Amphiura filiformis TaxID=82378 RepID=UPI003B20B607
MKPLYIVTTLTLGLLVTLTGIDASRAQKALFRHLFQDYNPRIRPVENDTETLLVEFGLSMSQLIDVDEKNQIITTCVWLKQAWTDSRLTWDPSEFANINVLQVPSEKLWIPDIVLFNNADGRYEVTLRTNVLLYPMGYLYWLPPAIFKSSCDIDVRYFPLDQQVCDMKFGSWTYNGGMVELIPMAPRVDLEDYWESGEWDIVDSPTTKNIIKYPSRNEIYSDITVNLVIRRKPLFYIVYLILPCILISCLTILVFYLPSDSQERITLCISILLALIVFLLLLADIIPTSSVLVPLIGRYLLFTMSLVSLSIIMCVIILNIHFRKPTTHIMSPFMRKLFLETLPPIFYMTRPTRRLSEQTRSKESQSSSSSSSFEMNDLQLGSTSSSGCSVNQQNHHHENVKSVKFSEIIGHVDSGNESACSDHVNKPNNKKKGYQKEFKQTVSIMRSIANYMKAEEKYDTVVDEWKYVAMVLDRICLWVFLIFVICGTCGIIMSSPSIFMPKVTQESA